MAKSESLDDSVRLKIVREELEHFKKLIEGHKKLLYAIGEL